MPTARSRSTRERFGDVGLFENAVYPDIAEVLAHAARSTPGRMFVATSKPHVFATRIIAHFGLQQAISTTCSALELDGTRVNKVELLAYALEQTGVDPAAAVMIGDRSHDVIGAKRNGIRAVGVTYGYGSSEELIEAGAQPSLRLTARECSTMSAVPG